MSNLPTPQLLHRWFKNSSHQVAYYHHKVAQLIQFNKRWKQQDTPIALHSEIACFEKTKLVFAVDSSVWATHLHYEKLELLSRLKNWPHLEQLMEIKWYVKPPIAPIQNQETAKVRILSEDNKQLIASIAQTIDSPSLQSALKSLADYSH